MIRLMLCFASWCSQRSKQPKELGSVKQAKFRDGRMIIKRDEAAEDSTDAILYELAQLRTRFLSEGTADEEKTVIAEEYNVLVDQLPEDIQVFHRGLVAGDVVE